MVLLESEASIILHGRTLDAHQRNNFQDKHFQIVNAVIGDGSREIENDYPEKQLHQIEHVMAKAIDKVSNTFRKFYGENRRPVYTTNDNNNGQKTEEYLKTLDETEFIAEEFIQELLDVAGLEIDTGDLLNKISFNNLIQYVCRKILGSTEGDFEDQLLEITPKEIIAVIDEAVPEENRWDYDNEVITSINYDQTGNRSTEEKKAMDLLFVLMNQLWKVQQVHRTNLENRISDEQLDNLDMSKIDARISEDRLEYQPYTEYLEDSYNRFSDESPIKGLIYAAFGVQKDLMIYLRN